MFGSVFGFGWGVGQGLVLICEYELDSGSQDSQFYL